MFSGVAVWMLQNLAGIQLADNSVACNVLRLAPEPPRGLGGVNGSWASPRGRVESNWTVSPSGDFEWRVRVPPNVLADVVIPGTSPVRFGSGLHMFRVSLADYWHEGSETDV